MSAFQPSLYVPPLGYLFDPTDEELVSHYLRTKISGEYCLGLELIEDMNVYGCEPWNLPHKNIPAFKENEWFYFVKRSQASGCKNFNGKRTKRTIEGDINGGSWKAIYGEKSVVSKAGQIIGYKQTLTFYTNKKNSAKGLRTDWIMKEYRLHSDLFQHFVLCKIRHKINPKQTLQGVMPCVPCIMGRIDQPQSSNASGLNASVLEPFASTLDLGFGASVPCMPRIYQHQSSDASGLNAAVLESSASTLDMGFGASARHMSGIDQPHSSDASTLVSSTSTLNMGCGSFAPCTPGIDQPLGSNACGLNASVLEPSAAALNVGCGKMMECNDVNAREADVDDWGIDEIFVSMSEDGEIIFG